MFQYIIKRFFAMLFVLWIVVTITFFLMHAVPGGPFTAEKKLPETVIKNLEKRYHLDDPLIKQYKDYLWNVLNFDFGPSFKYEDRTVNEIIKEGFPVSAELGFYSITLALLLGIPLGIIASLRHNRWQDYSTMFIAIIGVSVPSFILAPLLIYIFAFKLSLLPVAMWDGFEYVILPTVALAAAPMAIFARLMRASMLEVMAQDFIRTARAKGLSEWQIITRHALKNAITPVLTYLGPVAAGVLTGSFVIEQIFALPGLGRHFVTAIFNRDYTVILGLTVFDGALLVFFNFLVDIAYAWLDPRIKLGAKEEA